MDVFAQRRTYQRAALLGVSQLACLGSHTVTGLLCVAGKQQQDWSADYRFFSQDRWNPQPLFNSVLAGVLEFLPLGADVVCAMDDTLLRKTGTRIPDVAYRRDPLSPPFHINFVRGQRFLQLSAMLPQDSGLCAARAIPVRFLPAPPLPKATARTSQSDRLELQKLQRTYNLSTIGRDALVELRERLDRQGDARRKLVVCVDGSYTNHTVLRGLPERTVLIGRVRKDIRLFDPPEEPSQPSRGRPRRYGPAAPTPEALRQDDSKPWQVIPAFAAGKLHEFRVKTLGPVLWAKAGADLPLRVVVIAPLGYRLRKGSKLLYRQPAYLICTDPVKPRAEVVQQYVWRWEIEVNHRDEKQRIGVGEAQVRSLFSARRGPAFAVACYAKLLLAAARIYGPGGTQQNLPLPKWRRKRLGARMSTGDLIRQIRHDLWGQALRGLERNNGHFATHRPPTSSDPKIELSLPGAIDHAATG
jgi:hypothetical protein